MIDGSPMSTLTIAGAGKLAVALAQRRAGARVISPRPVTEPSWWRADLTSIPEAEVALAGTETLVVLARAQGAPARLTQAASDDLDRLLADSLGRAAKRVGVKHVVLFACGAEDVRAPLLRASGVPLSVLHGGGPDPVVHLEALIERGPGADLTTEPFRADRDPKGPREDLLVCSVQRFARPAGWSAEQLARAYLQWLPGKFPTVRTSTLGATSAITAFGTRALVLREAPGRSEPESFVLEVADGTLSRNATARFEFRVLLDQVTAMVALVGFEPTLPFPVYHVTQAFMHEHIMKRFGAFLADQR
jgi:hypothetical protein